MSTNELADLAAARAGTVVALLVCMNTTTKSWIQVGTMVYDSFGTDIAGQVEYVTEDGWVGVRDVDGRIDELPEERAVAWANQ